MKIRLTIYRVLLVGLFFLFMFSCQTLLFVKVLPTVTLAAITNITGTTTSSGGEITSDGGSAIIARGVCWNTSSNPTIADNSTSDGTGSGSFNSSITGLTMDMTYYIRAYATNAAGTAYSSQLTFKTLVSDIDGNLYHTVTIGTQVWLVENLKVTHYSNGELIPLTIVLSEFHTGKSYGTYGNYNDDANISTTYGRLYNWAAVKDSRGIAPTGWHVPSEAEWTTLIDYLGGANVAGGKLKESGTEHWQSPNTGASNEAGFTALPAGYCSYFTVSDRFQGLGTSSRWWSTDRSIPGYVYWMIFTNSSQIQKFDSFIEVDIYSVRCVKD